MDALRFVTKDESGNILCGWNVKPTGLWDENFEVGKNYASEAIDYVIRTQNLPILQRVFEDMFAAPKSAIRTGFVHQIGLLAMAGT